MAVVPTKMDEFRVLIARYYIRTLFSDACSADIPRNDHDLYKALAKETNKAIGEAGLKALGQRGTVGLGNVVTNLRSVEGSEEPPPKVRVEEAVLDNKTVFYFVMKKHRSIPGNAGNRQRILRRRCFPVEDKASW